jgi:hypothetical protein
MLSEIVGLLDGTNDFPRGSNWMAIMQSRLSLTECGNYCNPHLKNVGFTRKAKPPSALSLAARRLSK